MDSLTLDHLNRDVVVTEYLINSIERGFRVKYDEELLKSIDKKLKEDPCDYYSAFEKVILPITSTKI